MKKVLMVLTIFLLGNLSIAQNKERSQKIKLHTIIEAIDSGDPSQFAGLLTENSVFKFGNFPSAVGKSAIFKAQTDFFASVKSTKHTVLKSWKAPDSIVAQMEVTYIRLDGSTVTLPVTDIFMLKNNKIDQTLIYMDIAPLYQSQ
ncbi:MULTISPECIES: nuclear transport factor 2 family protein [Chryseobacterium]|uniref:nuclear transport factor 2 family protein n=1 Tax=Chryseobacterium TaxID=59732 RepID=UPI000691D173|nr:MULTISPECIES: nuclear transport factor 2 family protein [Chryseobacterium]QIX79781.1 nuclear transport factor 2 family protein [Chryseobacterium indologenes]UDQ53413.1 nuclear transport factor 2 family protein [Chryseobacterium indologenes]